jgi:hypothetical protein
LAQPLREHLLGSSRQVPLAVLHLVEELLQLLIPFPLCVLQVLLAGFAPL